MFNEERELLLPELESTQSALVLNTSMHPEHAPSQSTEPHDVTMALLAKAFGSAVTSIGTLDNSSKIAVDNNQQLDVERWNLRRRVGLALEAIFSPAAEKDLQKAFHRDERTLDMLDKQTFTYAQQLMSIKGDTEQDTEALRLKAAIFRQLEQKLQDNKTLSELERQSIADVAKVALSSDEDSKQHVYTTLNDKGYEKVRDDTRDRWIHGCYNAFISSSIKALSVLAAPAWGGWGGVALGTAFETAALHASTLKMQESAVLRSKEQRAKSIDGVLKQFLATHDASTGAKPVIIERFEQELRSFKDSGGENFTEVYSSAATIIAAGARLKELVESGEATLSAMTYKGYQEVLTYAERTKERLEETVELPEGTKDATSLADYARSLQRAASTLGGGNDVHIDVDQIRNAERDRLKEFTDRQLDEVRAKVVNPVRIVKTACLAGIGHSSAVLCAGLSEVGKQFQGIQAVGVHDNVMQLHEHVVDVAQKALSDQTGLPEWTTRPIAELYSVVTKALNEHTLGGAEQFKDLFVATRELPNGSIQELSAAEMNRIGTEAVGRSFKIPKNLSEEFIQKSFGENRKMTLNVAEQLNALAEKGYEQARFYDFSLNGKTYQKAAEVIGESFSTIAGVSFAVQVGIATRGINIEGSEREGWKLPKLGLFLRGSKQKVQDTNEQRVEESSRTSLESAQEEQRESPLVMEAALEERSDITTNSVSSSEASPVHVQHTPIAPLEVAHAPTMQQQHSLSIEEATSVFEQYRARYLHPTKGSEALHVISDDIGGYIAMTPYGSSNENTFFIGTIRYDEGRNIVQCGTSEIRACDVKGEVFQDVHQAPINDLLRADAEVLGTLADMGSVRVEHHDSVGNDWCWLQEFPGVKSVEGVADDLYRELVELRGTDGVVTQGVGEIAESGSQGIGQSSLEFQPVAEGAETIGYDISSTPANAELGEVTVLTSPTEAQVEAREVPESVVPDYLSGSSEDLSEFGFISVGAEQPQVESFTSGTQVELTTTNQPDNKQVTSIIGSDEVSFVVAQNENVPSLENQNSVVIPDKFLDPEGNAKYFEKWREENLLQEPDQQKEENVTRRNVLGFISRLFPWK